MNLRIGLLLSGGPAGSGPAVADASYDLVRVCRRAGFATIVAGQHFLSAPHTYLQPITLLARFIPETLGMNLVTGVLLLPYLNPVQLAEELATLDVLSDGRLIVGVGQGYRDVELNAFGVAPEERLSRQLESLALLKKIWSGNPIQHDGRFHSVHADGPSVTPVQSPHPPIWYAAGAERPFRRAAHEGYVPYIGPQATRDDLAALMHTPVDRFPDAVALRRDILVTDVVGPATVRRCVYAHESRYSSWGYRSAPKEGDDAVDSAGRYIIGSVDECRSALADYQALGVTDVVLRVTWPGLPIEASLAMIESLADVVPPRSISRRATKNAIAWRLVL